jgi:hypothetical protein
LVLPDWIGIIIAENLHYRLFNHLPASTILKTVMNFLYTPSLKQIIEKVGVGCGLCILESKVVIGKGLGETMVYDDLKPEEMIAVDTACNLPKTTRGNCYLMIVACCNSGYILPYDK